MFSNRLCISDVISMHIDANCLMNRYGNQFFSEGAYGNITQVKKQQTVIIINNTYFEQ